MLQAPSHLSRVSGHNHFKKSWLMQTQSESQTNVGCEKGYGLSCSSSRPVSCAPMIGADAKQNSHLSAGNSGVRRYITSGSSASCPIRPLVVAGVSTAATSVEGCDVNGKGLGERVTVLACAESEPGSSVLSSHDSKDDSCEEDSESLPFKRPTISFPASLSRSGESSEDVLYQRSPEPLTNVFDEAQLKDYSQRLNCLPLGNNARSLQRADSLSKLHLCVPDTCVVEEATFKYGFGISQKDLTSIHDSRSSPKLDCSEHEHYPESCKDLIGAEDARNATEDDPVEDQHLSFDVTGESCRSWMPIGLKGNSGFCTVQSKASGDDPQEVDNVQEVNATCNDGGVGRSVLRSCSHCGTTKTPLWRSGPQGPKSLCNACGIRFKKLRRSSGPNDNSDLHVSPPVTPNSNRAHFRSLKRKQDNAAKSSMSCSREDKIKTTVKAEAPQISKKSRWPSLYLNDEAGQRQDGNGGGCESYLSWSLQSSSLASRSQKKLFFEKYFKLQEQRDSKLAALSRAFADEEEEAAVLLMALSCGLVNA